MDYISTNFSVDNTSHFPVIADTQSYTEAIDYPTHATDTTGISNSHVSTMFLRYRL